MRPSLLTLLLFTLLCTCVPALNKGIKVKGIKGALLILPFLLFALTPLLPAQTSNSEEDRPLTYYLPDLNYDPAITTPEEFLGWQVGDWHVSHDLQQGYMRLLAGESDRIISSSPARKITAAWKKCGICTKSGT